MFGDYTNGRLWAIAPRRGGEGGDVVAMGGFGIAPVCFGRDNAGELYVGVQGGRIYKMVAGRIDPNQNRSKRPKIHEARK